MTLRLMWYALRPRHWIKNVFIFAPLLFGQKLFVYPENAQALIGFVLFCCMASAVYVINDIVDIKKDRAHALKRLRPIAAGKISVLQAWSLALVLLFVSLSGAIALNGLFAWVLVLYCVLNLIYSRYLKNIVIIDVFCLAAFFLLRIVAGTVIVNVKFSHWMIFALMLLAMYLGFYKRRQDIRFFKKSYRESNASIIKYNVYFIDQMCATLSASIPIIYMLYTVDKRTVDEFHTTNLIYTIPFVYYGIFRYQYLVHSRRQGDDPTAVMFKDPMMVCNVMLWIFSCIVIIYFM